MANHPLRRWREKRGLTQHELAARIGVDKTTICGYETGKRRPRDPNILKLIKKHTGGAITAEHFYGGVA